MLRSGELVSLTKHRVLGRAASFSLLAVVALTAMSASDASAGSSSTTCLVRNVTQGTSSRSFRVVVTLAHDGDRLEVRGICHPRGIEIDKDLVIRGIGAAPTLDGQARYRVLRIAKGAVVTSATPRAHTWAAPQRLLRSRWRDQQPGHAHPHRLPRDRERRGIHGRRHLQLRHPDPHPLEGVRPRHRVPRRRGQRDPGSGRWHLQHRDRDPGGLGRLPQLHGLRRVAASSTPAR